MARANLGRRTKVVENPTVHVRKNDTVVVLSGKDKDKKGKVLEVLPQKGKVLVDGVNIAKRHTKPRPGQTQGGILEKALPLNASKVQLICPKVQQAYPHRQEGCAQGRPHHLRSSLQALQRGDLTWQPEKTAKRQAKAADQGRRQRKGKWRKRRRQRSDEGGRRWT